MTKNRKMKEIKLIALLMMALFMTTAAGFHKNPPKLDLEEYPVYYAADIEDIAADMSADISRAYDEYDDDAIVLSGQITEIGKNNKTATLVSSSASIELKISDKSEIEKLTAPVNVTAYGRLQIDKKKPDKLLLEVDHISKGDNSLTKDRYIYNGRSYDDNDGLKVTLADGIVSYIIPASWKDLELVSDVEKGYFNQMIEAADCGKIYSIRDRVSSDAADLLIIFYFDNNVFLEVNNDKTDRKDIEKAIITNICPEEDFAILNPTKWGYPTEKSVNRSGLKLDHYVAKYNNYRAEFAFAPADEGICVMLHMYVNDKVITDDIRYVIDSLEINE